MKQRILVITLCVIMVGCSDSSSVMDGYSSQADNARYKEQMNKYDEQAARADTQLDLTDKQGKRMEALLKRWEEQADRYDLLLKKWESQENAKAE